MSSDDPDYKIDDMASKAESFSPVPSSDSSQTRHTRLAQPNVYTPLSLPTPSQSPQLSIRYEGTQKDTTACSKTDQDKDVAVKAKTGNSPKYQAGKSQRSSVRPFFCCGSELSLVSLVDGMDVKDEASDSKKIQSIECSSSSEDETFELTPFRSRFNTATPGDVARPSTLRRKKKDKHLVKKKFWSLRLQKKWNPRWRSQRSKLSKCPHDLSHQSIASGCSSSHNAAGPSGFHRQTPSVLSVSRANSPSPLLDLFHLFPMEDLAEVAIRRRAEEMAVGLEINTQTLSRAFRSTMDVSGSVMDIIRIRSRLGSSNSDGHNAPDSPIEDLLVNNLILQAQHPRGSMESWGSLAVPQIHTQIDYVHYLVPDLTKITGCSYYWGVMDRYEAEHLLENKPPGTFLLRDSAQEDFLFSVSFRRYNRSLHARIEQWNHRFSFDAHDPNVFSASTVCELMEHYKDPSLCMFFEPMLTRPLHRTFPFSLQHMCRTVICDRISYDHIQVLPIPNSFKKFLQTYHYKQKVRVRRFDAPEFASADSRVVN